MTKEDLISRIEEAFEREPQHHLRTTIDSNMGDYPDVRRQFHHRDWWTIDAAYWKQQDGAFSFMTAEARIYFTPSVLIESLRAPGIADTLPDFFVWNLDVNLIDRYSPAQLDAIILFLEFHLSQSAPWQNKNWREKLDLYRFSKEFS